MDKGNARAGVGPVDVPSARDPEMMPAPRGATICRIDTPKCAKYHPFDDGIGGPIPIAHLRFQVRSLEVKELC